MKTFIRALAVAGSMALAGAAAHAATFNLADQNRYSTSSFSVTSDGITMTVSGYGPTGDTVSTGYRYGLSVGDHLIDSNNNYYGQRDEYAILDFSEAVTLDSFYAGYVDYYDDYSIWAYMAGSWEMIQYDDFGVYNTYGYNSNRTTVYTSGDAATTVATRFAIGTYDYYDDFKIRNITVSAAPSEVPLPASGLLLLAGLGALGLRRRKA